MSGHETLCVVEAVPTAVEAARPRLRPEVLVVGSVLLAAAGQLTLKSGLLHPGQPLHWMPLVIGLGVYGLGTLLWIAAVSMAEISYLYPLSAINYTVVAVGGAVLFHESIRWDRWLGIAILSLGVLLLMHTASPEAKR